MQLRATVYKAYLCLATAQELLKVPGEQLPKVLLCLWKIQDGPVDNLTLTSQR